MHTESYELMRGMLPRTGEGLEVLDVGSLDVNGSFRPLIEERSWHYTGLDIRDGRNVDVLADDPYHYPFEDNTFDVVITGSTMEHVEAIWLWVPELYRVLKHGGMLCLHTHWSYQEHRFPIDCWRILPDGMRFLLDFAGFVDIDTRIANHMDIVAVAWRR